MLVESDSEARQYLERALNRWRATGGQNLSDHAEFQITQGQHREVQREWIGLVLETYYAHQLQTDERGPSAASWGEIPEAGKVLKVIVNPEGFVITVHFDRGELRRLVRERREAI